MTDPTHPRGSAYFSEPAAKLLPNVPPLRAPKTESNPVREILRAKLLNQKEEEEEEEDLKNSLEAEAREASDDEDENLTKGVNYLVKKLDEKQQELVNKRLAQQKKKMDDLATKRERLKIRHIQKILPHISYEEGKMALEDCSNDEEEAIAHLSDLSNLIEIRKGIATTAASCLPTPLVIKRVRHADDSADSKVLHRPRTRKGQRTYPKLSLDEALQRPNMEGWSEARRRAYVQRETNPNAYYYRFNDPGEHQRNGKWSQQEKQLFLDLIAKKGVDGQWGIFSRSIPGRVGYQCSNFYRHLIKEGEIVDPKYVFDQNGKLGYMFSSKLTKDGEIVTTQQGDEPPIATKRIRIHKKKNNKRRRGSEDEEDGDEDDEYIPVSSLREKNYEDQNKLMAQISNPLPDFIDPITLDPVEHPMISPNGIVMGRANWSRCLGQTPPNVCPLTKVTVHKRDLVLLTTENIHEYRDKIVNSNYM